MGMGGIDMDPWEIADESFALFAAASFWRSYVIQIMAS